MSKDIISYAFGFTPPKSKEYFTGKDLKNIGKSGKGPSIRIGAAKLDEEYLPNEVPKSEIFIDISKDYKGIGFKKKFKKGGMPARNKKNFRPTKSGAGMTKAGVAAYRRMNPGSKLQTAVTGKVKPGSKAAKRRKSYCARSLGQLKRASAKTRNDPNSRIRQARRRWKC
mgnify:CR=1 FL=1